MLLNVCRCAAKMVTAEQLTLPKSVGDAEEATRIFICGVLLMFGVAPETTNPPPPPSPDRHMISNSIFAI